MKNFITLVICILIILGIYINKEYLSNSFLSFITNNEPVLPEKISKYEKDYSLSFAKSTDSFVPLSNQDLLNILYTSINRGYENFTFYCPDEYKTCKSDIESLSKDVKSLTHLNNFVHPFNSFTNITMTISELGEIHVNVNYLYKNFEKNKIDEKVSEIINEVIKDNMSDEDKILTIHDYIINNTKYDVSINNNEKSKYNSSTAYGTLFEGYAICNGYTDLMAIFLNKFNIKNVKVSTTPDEISYSTTGHIWNAVYLNNEWKHIDLTWDDPVSEDGKDYLYHNYFLINTEKLHEQDNNGDEKYEEHNFNTYIYFELK